MLLALLLGVATAVANIIGAWLAILPKRPGRGVIASAIGFGGGFILTAALTEMLPESLDRADWAPLFVLVGYLLLYLVEHGLNVHLHALPEEHAESNPQAGVPPGSRPAHRHGANAAPAAVLIAAATSWSVVIAFNVHDFIDGMAIGASMVGGDVRLATLVFLAVLLHEVPAGFVIAAIVRGGGATRREALLAGTSLGLITLVGIAVPFVVGEFSNTVADALLAMAAGSFIYIGATILIPVAETGHRRLTYWYVVLGAILFLLSRAALEPFLGS